MRNNIGLLLAKRALLSPALDGLVEVERARRFTFADLNGHANRTANALRALGVEKGDRKKDLIISGGENIYPAEIENVILAHPKVREVAVIGQASAKWGESPLAIVVKHDPSLTEADVVEWTRGRLAGYKRPRTVRFIDEIPRNPAGKILKRVLREQFPEPAGE